MGHQQVVQSLLHLLTVLGFHFSRFAHNSKPKDDQRNFLIYIYHTEDLLLILTGILYTPSILIVLIQSMHVNRFHRVYLLWKRKFFLSNMASVHGKYKTRISVLSMRRMSLCLAIRVFHLPAKILVSLLALSKNV